MIFGSKLGHIVSLNSDFNPEDWTAIQKILRSSSFWVSSGGHTMLPPSQGLQVFLFMYLLHKKWVENLDHSLTYLYAVMWKMYARGYLFSSNLAILVRSSNLLVWTTGTFVNSLNTNKTGSISRPPWTTYIFFVVHSSTISTKSQTCQVGNLKKLVILLLHFFYRPLPYESQSCISQEFEFYHKNL